MLLHALCQSRDRIGAPLSAIHVDHALSPRAPAWADYCAAICRQWDVPLVRLRLDIRQAAGESPEAAARHARYEAFESCMRQGEALVTAHHRDDQAETLLLLLLRGSGARGLSAMPPARRFGPGWLLRPLLTYDRSALEDYARATNLNWIEDESNLETRFDRNFLRHRVLPLLRQRWPAVTATLARTARLCAESESLVREQAAADLQQISRGPALSIERLLSISAARQHAVLRLWLEGLGLPMADHRRLSEIGRQLAEAGSDRPLCVSWQGAQVRRHQGLLYAGPPLPPHAARESISWDASHPLQLPSGLGTLRLEQGDLGPLLQVRFRTGGETLVVRGMHRPVKKILQELGVPAWLRPRVPLVFSADRLVAIGDLCAAQGWKLQWQPGPGWPWRNKTADDTDRSA